MHLQSLERFDFDSVLLPYNFAMMQNRAYAADFEALLHLCRERNVAVPTIKSMVRRPWGDKTPTANIWYEPFQNQDVIDIAVQWVLRRPGIVLGTPAVMEILPKVLAAASGLPGIAPGEDLDTAIAQLRVEPLFV